MASAILYRAVIGDVGWHVLGVLGHFVVHIFAYSVVWYLVFSPTFASQTTRTEYVAVEIECWSRNCSQVELLFVSTLTVAWPSHVAGTLSRHR